MDFKVFDNNILITYLNISYISVRVFHTVTENMLYILTLVHEIQLYLIYPVNFRLFSMNMKLRINAVN